MQFFEYIDILNQPYDIFITESTHCSPHCHYYSEVLYMLKGELSVRGDGQETVLHAGDLCFIYPLQIHEICPAGESAASYAVLKFDIHFLNIPQVYGGGLYRFFTRQSDDSDICIRLGQQGADRERMKRQILQIVQEYQEQGEFYMLQIQSALCSVLVYMARTAKKASADMREAKWEEDSFFWHILEYIDAHSAAPLRAQELAELCHMSYSHFARLFREIYGRSCKEYITYIRVNKAREFLLHTEYDLNYIAMETGFFDCSHFIRTYKKWFGITPKQERKQAHMR